MDTVKFAIELHKAKIELLQLVKRDSVVFPIFSDLHTLSVDFEWTEDVLNALKMITDGVKCDFVLNLGDSVGMLGRDNHITNNDLKKLVAKVFDKIYRNINCPMFVVNGNHDGIGTDFFDVSFWNELTKGKFSNVDAEYDAEGSYYYVDIDEKDTRIVVLSLPSGSDMETEFPTPIWKFGEKQLSWLEQTALNTCKKVIILNHVPFWYEFKGDKDATIGVWDGEKERTSYIKDLSGAIEDIDEVSNILNDFNERTNNLVAVLSGHMHKDSLFGALEEKDGCKNPLSCPQVVTTGAFLPWDEHQDIGISVDIAVWTPSENSLDLIRIGDGESRKVL